MGRTLRKRRNVVQWWLLSDQAGWYLKRSVKSVQPKRWWIFRLFFISAIFFIKSPKIFFCTSEKIAKMKKIKESSFTFWLHWFYTFLRYHPAWSDNRAVLKKKSKKNSKFFLFKKSKLLWRHNAISKLELIPKNLQILCFLKSIKKWLSYSNYAVKNPKTENLTYKFYHQGT